MSADQQNQAILEAASAFEEGVMKPVFFAKLASLGFSPETEEEAQELWNIGVELLQTADSQAATATNSKAAMLKQAREKLQQATRGMADQSAAASRALLSQSPDLVKAAHALLKYQQAAAV